MAPDALAMKSIHEACAALVIVTGCAQDAFVSVDQVVFIQHVSAVLHAVVALQAVEIAHVEVVREDDGRTLAGGKLMGMIQDDLIGLCPQPANPGKDTTNYQEDQPAPVGGKRSIHRWLPIAWPGHPTAARGSISSLSAHSFGCAPVGSAASKRGTIPWDLQMSRVKAIMAGISIRMGQ
jgi:hypothetical protein